tara:strand:- start:173 stop:1333 length:1161 start_codon:yes stop_codon:yes gene_type:complete
MESPILQNSFRPFFIVAGIWATLAVPFWILNYFGLLIVADNFDILLWHQHEMLYGFIAAAITGFILTAIPNWTGRLPIKNKPLGFLVFLWIIGRIGFLTIPIIGAKVVALLDLPFLIILVLVILREIVSGKNWRNLPVIILISLFTLGNILVHLQLLDVIESAELGIRLSIFVLSILLALIGGRIVPSFTRNWLSQNQVNRFPSGAGIFDKVCLVSLVVFVIAQIITPYHQLTSLLALLAGLLHGIRLIRWKVWLTLSEPLIWILHVGYMWLSVALVLIGLAGLTDFVPYTSSYHALTIGAFSTMILGVMTRVSLGHTGRTLKATFGTTTIYVFITIASVLRVSESFLNDSRNLILSFSGIFWTLSFALFVFIYFPILTQPRKSNM